MKLPAFVIDRVQEQLKANHPALYPFINSLYQLGYITDEEHKLLRQARHEAFRGGYQFYETNLLICLFILEEQGV